MLGRRPRTLDRSGATASVEWSSATPTDLGQRIITYIVPEGASPRNFDKALIEHVSQSLSRHKRPRDVIFLEALPRNAMGKVQKTQLHL
ncbi:AMP-binding enzyme [Nocardia sp. KC 131]|uniref:AMP-binding enzyme n=1 Tax=Nocardia arseniciresistens TaxID=3392119 RepID=UPI00398E809E